MTQDDIIRMAREAGAHDNGHEVRFVEPRYLERFAALVRKYLLSTEIHTCHDNCQRFACVQTRNAVKAEREALLSLQAEVESLRDQNTDLDKQVAMLEKQLDGEYLMGFEGGREWAAKVCDALAEKDKLSNYYAIAARAIRARGNNAD